MPSSRKIFKTRDLFYNLLYNCKSKGCNLRTLFHCWYQQGQCLVALPPTLYSTPDITKETNEFAADCLGAYQMEFQLWKKPPCEVLSNYQIVLVMFNSFVPNAPFLYPVKGRIGNKWVNTSRPNYRHVMMQIW